MTYESEGVSAGANSLLDVRLRVDLEGSPLHEHHEGQMPTSARSLAATWGHPLLVRGRLEPPVRPSDELLAKLGGQNCWPGSPRPSSLLGRSSTMDCTFLDWSQRVCNRHTTLGIQGYERNTAGPLSWVPCGFRVAHGRLSNCLACMTERV